MTAECFTIIFNTNPKPDHFQHIPLIKSQYHHEISFCPAGKSGHLFLNSHALLPVGDPQCFRGLPQYFY